MANTHEQFRSYLEKIRLTSARRKGLIDSREANRDRIRNHFRDNLNRPIPNFHGQGSFSMHTNLNPLAEGDYDLDDGVYIQGLGTDMSKWPSAETVHGWIVDAVKDATSEPPVNKVPCVRVRYAKDYHIDLPSYAMNDQNVPMLFELKKEPTESDPRAFTDWFNAQAKEKGEQLKPIVRYLKGWRDYQGNEVKIATGLALTILAAHNFVSDDRDDVAIVNVLRAITNHLEKGHSIDKPVTPYENLAAHWTDDQRRTLIEKFKTFRDRGQDALDEEELHIATGIWQKQFGTRFPTTDSPKESSASSGPMQTPVSVTIPTNNTRSA